MAKNKTVKIPVTVKGSVVNLPDKPYDEDYEDFISAYLISAGYHTENQLIKREDSRSVLEIDIISTDNTGKKKWFEIKSAGWGIGDLFEMAGKKAYCTADQAFVFRESPDKKDTAAEKVAAKLGIDLISDDSADLSPLQERYPHLHSTRNEWCIPYLRFALFIERSMAQEISEARKSHKNQQGYEALSKFWRYVKQYSYFEKDSEARGLGLVNAFNKNRNLTARLANMDTEGNLPDDFDLCIPPNVFRRITYDCNSRDLLYGSQLAELTCRLKILRSIVDHILSPSKPNSQSWIDRLPRTLLNSHLHGAITELEHNPYIGLYLHFWQIFIYVFGGYIIEDHKQEEYEELSNLTGIPVDEIDNVLNVFDTMFPTPNGWFSVNRYSNIRHLKHVPCPLKGTGALARIRIFCIPANQSARQHYNSYVIKDMNKWANLSVEYIRYNDRSQTLPE